MNGHRDDRAALVAAGLAYDVHGTDAPLPAMPSAEGPAGAWAELIADHRPIFGREDRHSGFKSLLLEGPDRDGRPHRYYAVAGTEVSRASLVDIVAACSGGREQAGCRDADALVGDAVRFLAEGGVATLTGQSLGGGVVQPLAYRIARLADPEARGRFEMITWGAPGMAAVTRDVAAERAARGEGHGFDPELVTGFRTRNYFVEPDVIARVGDHLGETWAIPVTEAHRKRIAKFWREAAQGRFGDGGFGDLSEAYDALKDSPIGLHFVPGIMRAIEEAGGLDEAVPAAPETIPGSNAALELGFAAEGAIRRLFGDWLHKGEAGLQSLLFGGDKSTGGMGSASGLLDALNEQASDWIFGKRR